MAQIPVERRPARTGGGGAWWWVLVIAVIGLVVWLVYEWFDDDYYEDYGYVGTDAYLDDQAVTRDGAGGGFVEESTGPGGMGPMGHTDTLTSLSPVLGADDPAQFDGTDIRIQDLQVSQVLDDAATVQVEGQEVLVVFDGDARRSARNLTEGSMLHITNGEVHAIDELGDPQRYGLTDVQLQDQRFYLEADDLRMAG